MKIKLILIIVLVNIVQSCCLRSGEEIDRITFSEEAKSTIPYQENQIINMIHNEGFEFEANIFSNNYFYSNQEHCEDYFSYEFYGVEFKSEIPNLNIEISLRRGFENDDVPMVQISANFFVFYYDETASLEALQINGLDFDNVYRYNSEEQDNLISEILFNTSIGILKINYANGDYVQINP